MDFNKKHENSSENTIEEFRWWRRATNTVNNATSTVKQETQKIIKPSLEYAFSRAKNPTSNWGETIHSYFAKHGYTHCIAIESALKECVDNPENAENLALVDTVRMGKDIMDEKEINVLIGNVFLPPIVKEPYLEGNHDHVQSPQINISQMSVDVQTQQYNKLYYNFIKDIEYVNSTTFAIVLPNKPFDYKQLNELDLKPISLNIKGEIPKANMIIFSRDKLEEFTSTGRKILIPYMERKDKSSHIYLKVDNFYVYTTIYGSSCTIHHSNTGFFIEYHPASALNGIPGYL